ncbi:phosphatase PAP2 family protein [Sphingomonas sp.]|uniref:phosphatase PAP2 family protein n=1 Tax=Sphingomonas sp. TaxID=28214 RepID=UPI003CC514AC
MADRKASIPTTTVGRGLAALSIGALVLLAMLVAGSLLIAGNADAFDPAILLALRLSTGDAGQGIALASGVTSFGNDVTLWIVTALAAGYLAAARDRGTALRLCGTAASGGLVTTAIKIVVARPRPDVVAHLVAVHPPSFPSGHATNSAVVYGTLALIAAERASSRAVRLYLCVACVGLVCSIGATRVILGVHWPSDVLSGWAIGSGWALLAYHVFLRFLSRTRS